MFCNSISDIKKPIIWREKMGKCFYRWSKEERRLVEEEVTLVVIPPTNKNNGGENDEKVLERSAGQSTQGRRTSSGLDYAISSPA